MIKGELFDFWHLYFTGLCRLIVACMGLTMIDLDLIVKVTEIIFCSGLLSSIHFSTVYCSIVTYYQLQESECVGGATSVTVAVSSWRAYVFMTLCNEEKLCYILADVCINFYFCLYMYIYIMFFPVHTCV